MGTRAKIIFSGWLVAIFSLFLYSFTQIDLSLTLTRASFWQPIQKVFQDIGYFQRPLSTFFYLSILLLLFLFYFLILKAIKQKRFSPKQVWFLVILTAILLWFTYNAFSYDLFNYMFDAKIVTFYGQNPYRHRALDFADDPMLGFMHWTHRPYPYGPSWLAFTVPLSFVGFQKLIPTALLIKGLGVVGYFLSSWSIFKMLSILNEKKNLLGLAIFAFNPLVIIESLVSAHNDILMMGLALFSFYLLVKNKFFSGWVSFLLSVGIKFASVLLLPIFGWISFLQLKKKKINWEKVWLFSFLLMVLAVFGAVLRDELKPWYLLYPLSFLPFLIEKKWLVWPSLGLSLGGLLHYAPFLYFGNWDPPIPLIKMSLTLGFLVLGIFTFLVLKLVHGKNNQKDSPF